MKKAGVELPFAKAIANIRQHIRHDARGDGDITNGKRAEQLGIDPRLIVHIIFSDGGVTIGKTELTAKQIGQFLDTAEMTMNALILGSKVEVSSEGVVANQ